MKGPMHKTMRGRRPREQCSQLWIQYTMDDDGFCSSACNEKETRDDENDDDEEQPPVRAQEEGRVVGKDCRAPSDCLS
jgi:hypothetical protein